jgi:hypothetical protein
VRSRDYPSLSPVTRTRIDRGRRPKFSGGGRAVEPIALPSAWPQMPRQDRIGWLLEMAIAGRLDPADAKRLASLIEAARSPADDAGDRGDARDRLIAELDQAAAEIAMDPTELIRAVVEDERWPDLATAQPLWRDLAAAYGLAAPTAPERSEANSEGSE